MQRECDAGVRAGIGHHFGVRQPDFGNAVQAPAALRRRRRGRRVENAQARYNRRQQDGQRQRQGRRAKQRPDGPVLFALCHSW